MSRIAVVGGAGQVARLLHPLLLAAGHEPVALVRRPEHVRELEAAGVSTRHLDIESATTGDFAVAFAGCHAVVFAAGGGPDGNAARKQTVDLEGSLKSIAAATEVGIARFVQISAINADRPVADDAPAPWREYVRAKSEADAALRASGLDWTILRPGRLTDDPGTGMVRLAAEIDAGEVPRADVAAVVADVLDTGHGIGAQWDLVGGTTPVAEAVAEA